MSIEELCVLVNALTTQEVFEPNSCVKSDMLTVGSLIGNKGTIIRIVVNKENVARFMVTNDTRRSNYVDAVNALNLLRLGEIISPVDKYNDEY